MPNGLACAPRYFTKLMKPVYSCLRTQGFDSVTYIDDSLLIGNSPNECSRNVNATISLLRSLGFCINLKKSALTPSNEIKFLGFVINSTTMKVYLPNDKKLKIKEACLELLSSVICSIQQLASFIGLIVSSFNGVDYGALHYRCLERQKILALKMNRGNYEGLLTLSEDSLAEVKWWMEHIDSSFRDIRRNKPSVTLCSDASNEGWGAVLNDCSTGGRWLLCEKDFHINVLELKAVLFGLKSLCSHFSYSHIKLRIDNTTAVAYINKMGGIKSIECDLIAKEIWDWCASRHIWISAEHLPGSENIIADRESRIFHDDTEWMLSRSIFSRVVNLLGPVDLDVFASRLNCQCAKYVAGQPDPDAFRIDAFSFSWDGFKIYAFPPFSLVGKVLAKILTEDVNGTLIVPLWTTQFWFPRLVRMLIADPIVLPLNVISLPYKEGFHPLHKKLRLLACRVSGNRLCAEEYRQKLRSCSLHLGEIPRKPSIKRILTDGWLTVLDNRQIPIVRMR